MTDWGGKDEELIPHIIICKKLWVQCALPMLFAFILLIINIALVSIFKNVLNVFLFRFLICCKVVNNFSILVEVVAKYIYKGR